MKNLYEELDTMCLRCECRGDLKCGTLIHCKTYNNIYNALKILEKLISENPEKIRELEHQIKSLELQIDLGGELCEVFRKENNRLKATLKQADEAYDIQGKQLLEAQDRIKKLEAELEMQKNMTAVWSNRAKQMWINTKDKMYNKYLEKYCVNCQAYEDCDLIPIDSKGHMLDITIGEQCRDWLPIESGE